MHIIGILSAPTTFILYVCTSCGAYWIPDSKAEETPRKVAHDEIASGSGTEGLVEGAVGIVARRQNVVIDVKNLLILSA